MSSYHTAEVWHIEADVAHAATVELNAQTAYLHVPLELAIGSKADGPDHLNFLISALCVETPGGCTDSARTSAVSRSLAR